MRKKLVSIAGLLFAIVLFNANLYSQVDALVDVKNARGFRKGN